MLSSSFDISEFIRKVEGRSSKEVIYLADQEATAAERYIYQHKKCRQTHDDSDTCGDARKYAVLLKDFVQYMRYGVLTHSVRGLDLTPLGPRGGRFRDPGTEKKGGSLTIRPRSGGKTQSCPHGSLCCPTALL